MRRNPMILCCLFLAAIACDRGCIVLLADDVPVKPMNLEYSELDHNGFAKDPIWTWQRLHQGDDRPFPSPKALCGQFAVKNSDDPLHPPMSLGDPPCTDQSTGIDFPYGGHDFICSNFGGDAGSLHGHINWIPVTYDGTLYWEGLTPWYKLGDGDYNFSIVPGSQGGITADNSRALKSGRVALGVEFASSEVAGGFGSGWWKTFKKAGDDERHAVIDGSRAMVWGLLGLDSEHFAHSELHPVYAMAIEESNSGQDDDVWHLFVRNWGNEGFCSQNQHFLNSSEFQIFLPLKGVRTAKLLDTTKVSSNPSGLKWSFAPVADGVLMTFVLGPPASRQMFIADLHIQWTAASPVSNLIMRRNFLSSALIRQRAVQPLVAEIEGGEAAAPQREQDTESKMTEIWQQLSAAQQSELQQKLAEPEEAEAAGPAKQTPPSKAIRKSPYALYDFVLPPPSPQLARITAVEDGVKIRRDLKRAQAICRFQQSPGSPQLIKPLDCQKALALPSD